MISAIVDTNVLVRGALSRNPKSASRELVDAFFAGRFSLVLSTEALDELLAVLTQEDVRARHGKQTDEQILDFCRALEVRAHFVEPTVSVPASLTRDVTDTKFLALAQESSANYLVTKDNRHLLRLKQYHRTRIVTPSLFIRELDRLS